MPETAPNRTIQKTGDTLARFLGGRIFNDCKDAFDADGYIVCWPREPCDIAVEPIDLTGRGLF